MSNPIPYDQGSAFGGRVFISASEIRDIQAKLNRVVQKMNSLIEVSGTPNYALLEATVVNGVRTDSKDFGVVPSGTPGAQGQAFYNTVTGILSAMNALVGVDSIDLGGGGP